MMWNTQLSVVFLLFSVLVVSIHAVDFPSLDSVLINGGEMQGTDGRGITHPATSLPDTFRRSSRRLVARQSTGDPEPIMRWLVDKHNELRARHDAPALTWDWNLAWNAYDYVLYCPNGHSGVRGIGENLAWGHNDFNHAMRDWYDEIQFYNFNRPSWAQNTGHFTMLIWRSAAKIGCAANLKCRFRTWICQFTPAGNFVTYGGGVDVNLWTTEVRPPSQQWVTGAKPNGQPSYASYDPTGQSTRGLPTPQYGELKNFGFVPKPGQKVVMRDWQKYLPTGVLQSYLPRKVLEQFLDKDTINMLEPTTKGGKQLGRTVVGWQMQIPAAVIKQHIPLDVLEKYVPSGVVLAAEGDEDVTAATNSSSSSNSMGPPAATPAPRNTPDDSISQRAINPITAAPRFPPGAAAVLKPGSTAGSGNSGGGGLLPKGGLLGDGGDGLLGGGAGGLLGGNAGGPLGGGLLGDGLPVASGLMDGMLGDITRRQAAQQQQTQQTSAAGPTAMMVPVTTAQGTVAYVPADQLRPAVPCMQPQLPLGSGTPQQPGYAVPGQPQQYWTPQQQVNQAGQIPTPGAAQPTYGVQPASHVTGAVLKPVQVVQPVSSYPQQPVPHISQAVLKPEQPQQAAQQAQTPQTGPSIYSAPGGVSNIPINEQQGDAADTQHGTAPGAQSQQPQRPTTAAVLKPNMGSVEPDAKEQKPADTMIGDSGVLPDNLAAALNQHNQYRRTHQAAPLIWDKDLASQAADAARSCPMGKSGRIGLGENIAWGYTDVGAAVDSWYSGSSQYSFSAPDAASPAAAQFSQLVWSSTKILGCAVAPGCKLTTLVCFYSPQGNAADADWSSEVKPATAAVLKPITSSKSVVPSLQSVGKPVLPVDVPKVFWSRTGTPLSSSGAPISLAAPVRPAAAALLSDELQAALDQHNTYRLRHGAPALTWDSSIASTAQSWAAGCPSAHSNTPGVGENMAWGFASLSDAVTAWYNEVKLYDFSKPGWSTSTGHFTQVVWVSTTKLGCAVNTACSWPTYVCQYGPPGNVIGVDWSAQVKAESTPVNPSTPSPAQQPQQPTPAPSKPPSTTKPATDLSASSPIKPLAVKLTTLQRQALTRHNKYRKQHGSPGLSWDASIAAQAQKFADSCPSGHSGAAGVGENMAWGHADFNAAVDAWYNEVSAYDYSSGSYQPGTGHFTQVIWRATRKLGCAVGSKCSWKVYVCNYQVQGNVIGSTWSRNVPRPVGMVLKPATDQHQHAAAAVLKPTTTTTTAVAVLKPEYQAALDRTNMYRQRHQAAPLVWDETVAASAAQWAAGCPNGHSGYSGLGENMAWGYPSLTAAVDAWYNEVKLYDFSKPGWNTATGHFTALVWTDTTKLGCAQNTACSWPTYVCQYKSPGNVIGLDWSQKVKPPVQTPSSPATRPAPSPSAKPVSSPSPVLKSPASSPSTRPASPSLSPAVTKSSSSPSPSPKPLVSPQPVTPPAAPQTADMQQVLNLHNTYRKLHQVPGLVWSEKLVASAKAWTNTCQFAVSNTPGVGEAIGFGYATFADAVKAWYNQVLQYNFATPGWSSRTGLFTQMVWRDTTAVGCAANIACPWAMYVCHYSSPGNLIGPTVDWSKQVMRPAPATPTSAAVLKPNMKDNRHKKPQTYTPFDLGKLVPGQGVGTGLQNDFDKMVTGSMTSAHGAAASSGLLDAAVPSNRQLKQALNQTNMYRSKHKVSPLVWDADLAAQAAEFVASCPLGHSNTRGVGENIAWGHQSFSAVVDAWYAESLSHNYDDPTWSPSTGHFTQLVWRGTTRVGCAVTKKCTWTTFVCQYEPPGNDIGADWAEQVPAPFSSSSDDHDGDHSAAYSTWTPALLPAELPEQQDDDDDVDAEDDITDGDGDLPDADGDITDDLSPDDTSSSSDIDPDAPDEIPVDQPAPDHNTQPDDNDQQQPSDILPPTDAADDFTINTPLPNTDQQPPQGQNPTQDPGAGPIFDVVLPRAADYRSQPEPAPDAPEPGVSDDHSSSCSSSGGDGGGDDDDGDGGDALASAPLSSSPGSLVTTPPPETETLVNTPTPITPTITTTITTTPHPPSATPSAPPSPSLPADLQSALDKTNNYRQTHQAPPLQWDAALAAQAAAYIRSCPRGHSGAAGVGENLAWGHSSLSAAVDDWYREVKAYNFARGGFSSATGHFTQLVWRSSSRVGCAVNRDCSWSTYICQYAAAGNVMGVDWSKEVMPASAPPAASSTTAARQRDSTFIPADLQSPSQSHPAPVQQTNPTSSSISGSVDPSVPAEFATVVSATNAYRAKHQVPALKWDASIAARAQQYAADCPSGHSGDKGVGENLAWGYPSWQSAVDGWYSEVSQYNFRNPGWSSATGHFTQLVWRETTRFGCGLNTKCGMATYVCQYAAPGNVLGVDWSQQVLPAKA